jgi:hypothetical protein
MKAASCANNVCLIVIDGWGIAGAENQGKDAIKNANTPIMDKLCSEHSNLELEAHGLHVGLPAGLMGNSEVGHLNIGAGRVVYQDIVRIDLEIKKKKAKRSSDKKSKEQGLGDLNEDDGFGAMDSDWQIYREIRRTEQSDEEEDERDQERLTRIEGKLEEHDSGFYEVVAEEIDRKSVV